MTTPRTPNESNSTKPNFPGSSKMKRANHSAHFFRKLEGNSLSGQRTRTPSSPRLLTRLDMSLSPSQSGSQVSQGTPSTLTKSTPTDSPSLAPSRIPDVLRTALKPHTTGPRHGTSSTKPWPLFLRIERLNCVSTTHGSALGLARTTTVLTTASSLSTGKSEWKSRREGTLRSTSFENSTTSRSHASMTSCVESSVLKRTRDLEDQADETAPNPQRSKHQATASTRDVAPSHLDANISTFARDAAGVVALWRNAPIHLASLEPDQLVFGEDSFGISRKTDTALPHSPLSASPPFLDRLRTNLDQKYFPPSPLGFPSLGAEPGQLE